MKPLSFREFDQRYQEAVHNVLSVWTPEMQSLLATHSYGWRPQEFDFDNYLRASSVRFFNAYVAFAEHKQRLSVCDVGGFWGVFPITLAQLGFDVTMTESLRYYGGAFDQLFESIRREGVKVIDYDPFESDGAMPERFDVITVMAVLEHYPHSLKVFMKNVKTLLRADGRIYLEVPNIAYLPRRIRFLFGQSPLTSLEDIFRSDVPFIGHHHEFTMSELRNLAQLSGLTILKENCYNYSVKTQSLVKRMAGSLLELPGLRTSCECLAILCKQSGSI